MTMTLMMTTTTMVQRVRMKSEFWMTSAWVVRFLYVM